MMVFGGQGHKGELLGDLWVPRRNVTGEEERERTCVSEIFFLCERNIVVFRS